MTSLTLRPWSEADLPLLRRANTPSMTAHLNGPESEEQLIERHARYLRLGAEGRARTFVIVDDGEDVGSIAYWILDRDDDPAYEAGWFVLPEAQGRGIASAALALLIDDARSQAGGPRVLVAFPGADNPASNAVCRANGFAYTRTFTETFRERELTVNEWRLDLTA